MNKNDDRLLRNRNVSHFYEGASKTINVSYRVGKELFYEQINFDNFDNGDDLVSVYKRMNVKNGKIAPDEQNIIKYRINLALVYKKYYTYNEELTRFEKALAILSFDKIEDLRKIAEGDENVTIYDYNNYEKFDKITIECSNEINSIRQTNSQIETFQILLDLTSSDKEFSKKFPIDKNGCLYYLISKYASSKKDREALLKTPQITNFKLSKDKNIICSILGNTEFKLFIKNPIDIFIKYLETDARKIKILKEIYNGKLYRYCHYASAELGKNYNIVSAFIPGKFKDHRFVHSYLEKDGQVYDVSHNLIMTKENYYNLLTPEIVSNLPGEMLYKMLQNNAEYNGKKLEKFYLDWIDNILDEKGTKYIHKKN